MNILEKNCNYWDLLNEWCEDGFWIDWRVVVDWFVVYDKFFGFMSFINGNKCRKLVI